MEAITVKAVSMEGKKTEYVHTLNASGLATSRLFAALVEQHQQADGSVVMRSIGQGETVSVGDTVFTSGMGRNFPRQILIGQIVEAERRDYELYQSATVQPTVDFDHLEAVLIVTGFEPIEETEPEDEAP